MRAIEAVVDVDAEGHLRLFTLESLPPGHHSVLVVLADSDVEQIPDPSSPIPHPIVDGGGWPEGFTVSRSQLYDDDER